MGGETGVPGGKPPKNLLLIIACPAMTQSYETKLNMSSDKKVLNVMRIVLWINHDPILWDEEETILC